MRTGGVFCALVTLCLVLVSIFRVFLPSLEKTDVDDQLVNCYGLIPEP